MGNVKTKSASGKKVEKNRCLSHYWVPNNGNWAPDDRRRNSRNAASLNILFNNLINLFYNDRLVKIFLRI